MAVEANTQNMTHTLALLLLRGEFEVFLFCRAEVFGYRHSNKGMLCTLSKIVFGKNIHMNGWLILFQINT